MWDDKPEKAMRRVSREALGWLSERVEGRYKTMTVGRDLRHQKVEENALETRLDALLDDAPVDVVLEITGSDGTCVVTASVEYTDGMGFPLTYTRLAVNPSHGRHPESALTMTCAGAVLDCVQSVVG